MKKIKLFTALATAGMTTGILLPLVTSCNVATTGEIKFKLGEGVTAKANPFKVGDKVVINYDVTDENYTIGLDNIVVKFDGWKVEQSNKTWKLDTRKCTITIFSAPTTDITIKISCSEEGGSALKTIYLATLEHCTVWNTGGESFGEDITSFKCPGSYTTYGQFFDYISGSYMVIEATNYTWDGTWVTEDGTPITNSMAIDWSVTIKPHMINDEEEGYTEDDKVTLYCEPIYYNDTPYYIGSFSVVERGVTDSRYNFSTFINQSAATTLQNFLDEMGDNFKVNPSFGCTFKGWFVDDAENPTDPRNINLADFRKGATPQHTLTAKFDIQEEVYKMNSVIPAKSGDPSSAITISSAITAYTPVYLLWDSRAEITGGNSNSNNLKTQAASTPGIYLTDGSNNLLCKYAKYDAEGVYYSGWCHTNDSGRIYVLGDDGTTHILNSTKGLTLNHYTSNTTIVDPFTWGVVVVRIYFSEDIPAGYKICFGEIPQETF